MMIRLVSILTLSMILISPAVFAQSVENTDVAAYQLGLQAEALPGSTLTYVITVTNSGPSIVDTFYIFDGWTVNDEGISGFKEPLTDPDFGTFNLLGSWQQHLEDQDIVAWLLEGQLAPGDTIQFDWTVQVDTAYQGVLINWASILTDGGLEGTWEARSDSALSAPPPVENVVDLNPNNNRTSDGITVITNSPVGEGVDLALYQTGLLSNISSNQPLASTWLVANHGPQAIQQFYLAASWTLNTDGGSVLAQPAAEPNFGDFKVIGRWRQFQADEEVWLWLLEGPLEAGQSVTFEWVRKIDPTYRGDIINWAKLHLQTPPEGEWVSREGTSATPPTLDNQADGFPDDNRSLDALTTING